MNANSHDAVLPTLGSFLRDRRSRLQPIAEGSSRRRTPGLRREEVAARAGVSVTWYTWLEQGRGGLPSENVLERLASVLELDAAGREVLFLLAQQRPPRLAPVSSPPVSPELQRVLDAMPLTPAYVKTLTWDIVGWNAAASALTDFTPLPAEKRNVLRRLFSESGMRTRLPDWEDEARFAVAAFRLDAARTGGSAEIATLVAELQENSPDFRRIWAENEARRHGIHMRRIHHPQAGLLTLECSIFSVESSDGLSILVYTPATEKDADAIAALLVDKPKAAKKKGQ